MANSQGKDVDKGNNHSKQSRASIRGETLSDQAKQSSTPETKSDQSTGVITFNFLR